MWIEVEDDYKFMDRLGSGPHLVGHLVLGGQVRASFQIFALKMHFTFEHPQIRRSTWYRSV